MSHSNKCMAFNLQCGKKSMKIDYDNFRVILVLKHGCITYNIYRLYVHK